MKSLKTPKGGNQNPYIEEEQTTQWPKEKVHKDKQRSTKHTYTTKDRGRLRYRSTKLIRHCVCVHTSSSSYLCRPNVPRSC
jgi:hypothetical protein